MSRTTLAVTVLVSLIPGVTMGADKPPVPPFVAGFDRFARAGHIKSEMAGRLLITELSCTACHSSDHKEWNPKRGPDLSGAGDRLQTEWMRRFLAAPHVEKPGTTMPDLLGSIPEPERDRTIEALVAYLSSRHLPFPELKASGAKPIPHEVWANGDRERGAKLYHQVGCVACHAPDPTIEKKPPGNSDLERMLEFLEPEDIEAMGLKGLLQPVRPVPHSDLKAKYTSKSLTFFLIDPTKTRSGGRMPNMKLTPVEAADLTAYLLHESRPQPTPDQQNDPASLVSEGKRLFQQLRCVNCHSTGEQQTPSMSPSLAKLNWDEPQSCLGEPRRDRPSYRLDDAQQKALKVAVQQSQPASLNDRLIANVLRLNCVACHERDELGGVGRDQRGYFETVGQVDLGDEGRVPPSLEGVGRKLRTEWIERVLAGKADVRPHMLARMPVFPADSVRDLGRMFAVADRHELASEQEVFGNSTGRVEVVNAGRTLMDAGCVSCHQIKGEALPGVVGIDLDGVTNRIHPRWFREFLLDPGSIKKRTRMPTFFADGKSTRPDLLDGDIDRQIAALWIYLKEVDRHPLPEKLAQARAQDLELTPTDRPIVFRTFMKEAGTHAIAVGFREKLHLAFDAERVRPVQFWRGRFLDAQGTWFDRFSPPAVPLGTDVISLPDGVPLARLKSIRDPWPTDANASDTYQFKGYWLDSDGVPTFQYQVSSFLIHDRFSPSPPSGFKRVVLIKQEQPIDDSTSLWFRVHTGSRLRRVTDSAYANELGLTVTLTNENGHVRKHDDNTEWIIPIQFRDRQASVELEYQWNSEKAPR